MPTYRIGRLETLKDFKTELAKARAAKDKSVSKAVVDIIAGRAREMYVKMLEKVRVN
jgi:hypothetical protein